MTPIKQPVQFQRISFNISELISKMIFQSPIFTLAVVMSYDFHLHIKMAALISQGFQFGIQVS